MNRRRLLCGFFGGLAAAAAAPAAPAPTGVAGPSEAPAAARARHFRQALPSKPWLRTMEGLVADPAPVPQLEISGRMPRRLEGVLFRNGPAGYELGGLTSLTRLDLESGALTSYRYPDTELPEEQLFVPYSERSGEGEGRVIGTSLDGSRRQTHLNVFEAVGDGPIARATLDALMPQGLHERWVEHAA